jgi:hypothetical protein
LKLFGIFWYQNLYTKVGIIGSDLKRRLAAQRAVGGHRAKYKNENSFFNVHVI